MALDTRVLTQLQTVKDELGITGGASDPRLERLITVATDLIESECDRVFAFNGAVSEKLKGFGTPHLVVGRVPLVFITSLSLFDSVLDPSGYEALVDPVTRRMDSGIILRKGADFSTQTWPWTASRRPDIVQDKMPGSEAPAITVVYGGGFVTPEQAASPGWAAANPLAPTRTLPTDLEQAAIETTVSLFKSSNQDRNLTLEAVTDAQQSWGRGRELIPEVVKTIISKYRRIAGA